MSFTEAEKQQWHADRKGGKGTEDVYNAPSARCAHCGASLGRDAGGSDFPLCDACDD